MSRPRPERRAWPALVLLAAALPAAAEDPPALAGGGALRLSAEPARLVLGVDGGADLRIAAPPEVEELILSASAGRIENVRRVPGGGFTARYHPPTERYPQVAILVALGRGPRPSLDGWLAVPLSGQGEAKVPGRPGEDVELRIADANFGPARVGPDGLARLAVVVPPGVREGHQGFTPVDLSIPETPLVHAVIERATVLADRREQIRFLAYVVAPHGAARRADPPLLEPTRGTALVTAREPGAFEGVWTLPPGLAGEERLTVRLPGLTASRALLRVQGVPGPPATVAVAFDRPAGTGGDEVVVTARALDAAGNATATALQLETDAGVVAAPTEAGQGAITARVQVPERLGGRTRLVVTAWTPQGGISGARSLALEAGPAAAAAFEPTEDVVQADGVRELTLTLRAADRFGNPVRTSPSVTAGHGQVVQVEGPTGDGWRVRYRPAAVTARTPERLVAEVGDARGEADLLLVPAQRGPAFFLSGGAGAVLGGGGGPWLGAAMTMPLSGARLPWMANVAGALRVELTAFAFDGAQERRTVSLLAGPELRRELRHGPELWVAGTAGLLWGRSGAGAESADGLAPAGRLSVGAGWPGRRITPYLEAGLQAAGHTPVGGFASVQLAAGLRLEPGAWTWRRSSSSTTSR